MYRPMSKVDAEKLVSALTDAGVTGARIEPLAWTAPGLYGSDDYLVGVEPHTFYIEKSSDPDTYYWDHGRPGAGWDEYRGTLADLVRAMRARQDNRP